MWRQVLACLFGWCAVAPAQAPWRTNARYELPVETFEAPQQLQALLVDIRQMPAQAATRLGNLLRESANKLMELDDGRTMSVAAWVDSLPDADRQALMPECRRQFDKPAGEALAALRLDPAASAEDFHALARRWPMSNAAIEALVEAGDRAARFGDAAAAAAFLELARQAGWTPDEQRSITLAVCHYLSGQPLAPLSAAAARRIAELASRATDYRGPIAFDAAWWGKTDAAGIAKTMPLAADGTIYLAGPRHVLAIKETGQAVWSYTSPQVAREYKLDRVPGAGRAQTFTLSALWSPAGPEIIVVRQPGASRRDSCLRALRAADGRSLWTTETNSALDGWTFIGNPAVVGRYVYALSLVWANDQATLSLTALETLDGKLLWRAPLGTMHRMRRHREDDQRDWDGFWEQAEPLVAGDMVILTPNVGYIMVVGRFDGALRWIRPYVTPAPGDPRAVRLRGHRDIARQPIPADPPLLLRPAAASTIAGMYGKAPVLVCAPQDHPSIFALEWPSGRRLWEQTNPAAPILVGSAGNVAVFAGPQVQGLEVATGKSLWLHAPAAGQSITGPPVIVGQTVFVPVTGRILALSAITGKAIDGPLRPPNFRSLVTSEAGKRLIEPTGLLKTFGQP